MRPARESFPLRVFPTEIKQQVHLTSWMELYADPSRSLNASACFFHRRINRESRVFLPVFHHRIRCENRVFLRVFHRRIRCESRAAAQLSTQNPPKTLIMLIRQRDKVNKMHSAVYWNRQLQDYRTHTCRRMSGNLYFFFLITIVLAFVVKEPTTPSVT